MLQGSRHKLPPLLVVFTTVLLLAAPAAAQEHLDGRSAVEAICKLSGPLPARPRPTVAARAVARPGKLDIPTYVEARTVSLMRVYSIDVDADRFEFAEYDATHRLLMVTSRPGYSVFDGTYLVGFDAEPLLVFDAEPALAAELQSGHAAGQLALRLYFVLSALEKPDRSLCSPVGGGRIRLDTRLLAAQLWRPREAGSAPSRLTDEDVIVEHRLPEASATASSYGLDLDGRNGPLPAVTINQAGRGGRLSRDLERLVLPCYLEAIARGGPQTAALTFEARFENEEARSSIVNVDATGFPPLGACVVSRVSYLRAPGARGERRVRFTAYFERR